MLPSPNASTLRSIRTGAKWLLMLPISLTDALGTLYSQGLGFLIPSFKSAWRDKTRHRFESSIAVVSHRTRHEVVTLKFHTPNSLCQFRARTFSSKEPDTLEWIDEYGDGGVLYDIGANIGLYSVYFAKTKGCPVYAFEPSVFNLPALAKNINANGVQAQVRIVANPLSSSDGFAEFKLGSLEEGGALSAFGVDYGHDGQELRSTFSYQTCGFSLDTLVERGIIDQKPSLIKVDVDGIEPLILDGARKTLSAPTCRSVLIEVDEAFAASAATVSEILSASGFTLQSKKRSPLSDDGVFDHVYNQVWAKK